MKDDIAKIMRTQCTNVYCPGFDVSIALIFNYMY
jgi:hypothetical protein